MVFETLENSDCAPSSLQRGASNRNFRRAQKYAPNFSSGSFFDIRGRIKMAVLIKRKSQAALEFLMVYGWAILAVLVSIGALNYFGVLSPDMFLPQRCILPPGITCMDFDVSASAVSVALQNNMAGDISVDEVAIAKKEGVSCTYSIPFILMSDGKITIAISGCDFGDIGQRFYGDINVTYTNLDTLLIHKSRGTMVARLSE